MLLTVDKHRATRDMKLNRSKLPKDSCNERDERAAWAGILSCKNTASAPFYGQSSLTAHQTGQLVCHKELAGSPPLSSPICGAELCGEGARTANSRQRGERAAGRSSSVLLGYQLLPAIAPFTHSETNQAHLSGFQRSSTHSGKTLKYSRGCC